MAETYGIELTEDEIRVLEEWVRNPPIPAGNRSKDPAEWRRRWSDRAQIILLRHEKIYLQGIANRLDIALPQVRKWILAYRQHGIDGLRGTQGKNKPKRGDTAG